jgi:hypothetical protein
MMAELDRLEVHTHQQKTANKGKSCQLENSSGIGAVSNRREE